MYLVVSICHFHFPYWAITPALQYSALSYWPGPFTMHCAVSANNLLDELKSNWTNKQTSKDCKVKSHRGRRWPGKTGGAIGFALNFLYTQAPISLAFLFFKKKKVTMLLLQPR